MVGILQRRCKHGIDGVSIACSTLCSTPVNERREILGNAMHIVDVKDASAVRMIQAADLFQR